MTRTLSLMFLTAAFIGCAAFQIQVLPPGSGVDDNMAISVCGSLELFTSLVTEEQAWRAENPEVAYARPRVGQSLCELYASIGAPSNSEIIESADGLDEMELQYRTRGSGVANVQIRDSVATSRVEEGPAVNNGFLEKQIRTISTMVSALSSEMAVSSLSPQYGGSVWFL